MCGATQEYQNVLIQRVKDDIRSLQEYFRTKYANSEAYHMSQTRDLPPIAGAIIWAKQVERQLDTYMARVQDVLGEGWEQIVEGQKLKKDSDSFREKLNPDHIFERWKKETKERYLGNTRKASSTMVGGTGEYMESVFENWSIFTISNMTGRLQLSVNFQSQIITLFKEVRNLEWLGFQIPHEIKYAANGAKMVYPYAMSVLEAVHIYNSTCSKVEDSIAPLIAMQKTDVQKIIANGIRLTWGKDSDTLKRYVKKLSSSVTSLQDKTTDVLAKYDEISNIFNQLRECPFEEEAFKGLLVKAQRLVGELELASYSNLRQWIAKMDLELEKILMDRHKGTQPCAATRICMRGAARVHVRVGAAWHIRAGAIAGWGNSSSSGSSRSRRRRMAPTRRRRIGVTVTKRWTRRPRRRRNAMRS